MAESRSATLLVCCPDQQGLVSALSTFISDNKGNILDLEQYVDAENSVFFMRVQWDLTGFSISEQELPKAIDALATGLGMNWRLHYSDERPRMAVFVSRYSHCMLDIFARIQAGEWQVDIPCVISNHDELRPLAENLGIAFQIKDDLLDILGKERKTGKPSGNDINRLLGVLVQTLPDNGGQTMEPA